MVSTRPLSLYWLMHCSALVASWFSDQTQHYTWRCFSAIRRQRPSRRSSSWHDGGRLGPRVYCGGRCPALLRNRTSFLAPPLWVHERNCTGGGGLLNVLKSCAFCFFLLGPLGNVWQQCNAFLSTI